MTDCRGYTYTIKEGDTIVSISRSFDIKLADLINANLEMDDLTMLVPGEPICIPRFKGRALGQDHACGVRLPAGFRIEKAAGDLRYPTGICFNEDGDLFAVESGYHHKTSGQSFQSAGPARILKIGPGGRQKEIVRGFAPPVTGITWHNKSFYISESGYPGQITRVFPDGTRQTVLRGLPTGGDHPLSQVVFGPDGKMYFGIGSATNSGVVGRDNVWSVKRPKFHDVQSRDLIISGSTSGFRPQGERTAAGQVIPAGFPCTAALYRANSDGTGPEIIADGIRNPFGINFSPGGKLYFTDNGMDERGCRPVARAWDTFEEWVPGGWYGWPDFSARIPVTDTRFKPADGPQPEYLLQKHPPLAPGPAAVFPPHSVAAKFDFAVRPDFGYAGEVFVALYGHLSHNRLPLPEPEGFKIVRVNPSTGEVHDFLVVLDPESTKCPGHLIDAKFSPDGRSLYVVDFGKPRWKGKTVKPTGAVWKVSRV